MTPQMDKTQKSGCGGPTVDGDLSLKNLLKKIGKGPKLAQDLSKEEAKAALVQILNQSAPMEQIGAFLVAMRIKGESAEEIAGFVAALKDSSLSLDLGFAKHVELASAHDGKNKSLVLTPFVALILAAAGIPTLVTGGRNVPTKKGICASLIFDELGISTNSSAEKIQWNLAEHHFAYWDVAQYSPKLESLKTLRENMGLRTPINTIEKVICPTNATHVSTGVFHGPYLLELALACQILNYKNVLCLQASEASTDLPLKKRTLYRRLKNGELSEQLEIAPQNFGFKRDLDVLFENVSVKENCKRVLSAMEEKSGLVYDSLVYNAGIQFWFCETSQTIGEGILLARELICSGAVLNKIDDLKK